MIGFDKNTQEGPVSKFIRVSPETAIADGRFIVELESGQMEDGTAWLQCKVADTSGATANKRWFEPTMGGYIDDAEKLKKAQDKIVKIVANLVRRFKGEEYLISAATFKEFFDKAVATVKAVPDWDKKELQVLVVNGKPTDDGSVFPTLPTFAPIFADKGSTNKLRITEYHDVKAWEPNSVTPDEDVVPSSNLGSNEDVSF